MSREVQTLLRVRPSTPGQPKAASSRLTSPLIMNGEEVARVPGDPKAYLVYRHHCSGK